jgi:hypothetical protein
MLIVELLEEWRGEERKKWIYTFKIDGRDELNPMNEPNLTPNESSGRGKAHPDFFKPAQWFGAKIMPLGRHMGWVSVRTIKYFEVQ